MTVAAIQKSMVSLAPRCDVAALREEEHANVEDALSAVADAAAAGAQIVLLPVRNTGAYLRCHFRPLTTLLSRLCRNCLLDGTSARTKAKRFSNSRSRQV